MENASDVWLALKERFAQGDLIHVYELQQEVYTLKQDSHAVTQVYFDMMNIYFKKIW
jgi:hypothetical protein